MQALCSLGLVTCLLTGGTWASWSDSAKITGSTLTTGRLDLKVNGLDTVTGYTALSLSNAYPGASSAGQLTIKNDGTLPFTYTMASTGTNADGKNLVASLVPTISTGSTVSGSAPTTTCAGGTTVGGLGTSFSGSLIGTAGKRTLAAGASETLCIQATVSTSAPTTTQDATTALTITVTADQVP